MGCAAASGVADLADRGVVLTAGADEAFSTRGVSMVEPRLPCPRCGAHVLIEARAADHLSLVCPVCGLKWDEPKRRSE
jgi:DNA-directed RNA polymerase subunit RPC12/RpoP